MKSKRLKGFGQIEKEFFDIDGKTAKVCLHFESLDDVFDVNCLSKTPIVNDDFDEWLQSAFQTIPVKYKVALEITFDDLGGYTQEELNDIFRKNLLLSGRTLAQSIRARDHVAIGLLIAGLLLLPGHRNDCALLGGGGHFAGGEPGTAPDHSGLPGETFRHRLL